MGKHLSANATVAAHGAVVITVSDTTVIPTTRAIYVGTSGNIRVQTAEGQDITFSNVPVGVFPLQVEKVFSTSTTASNLIALY